MTSNFVSIIVKLSMKEFGIFIGWGQLLYDFLNYRFMRLISDINLQPDISQ